LEEVKSAHTAVVEQLEQELKQKTENKTMFSKAGEKHDADIEKVRK